MPITINSVPTDPKGTTISEKIEFKLKGLGISKFKVKEPIIGPIITGYPLSLHSSTPINKIMSKEEDIALALGVDTISIERVKGDLVIFVPNADRKIVDFKDALYWFLKDEKVAEMKIPILIGMDFQGNNFALDLHEQPHMLIAGATGSGKSILESSIISALVMKKNEAQLDLYIVDPKRVDLTMFDSLPQVKRLIKEVADYAETMDYLYAEAQNRQKVLEAKQCRNIAEWNEKFPNNPMKYKVLIIDELADLIQKGKYEKIDVLNPLQKLIQICRAAGIHIIACTQRTTVDVITGTIKANFPTRIALSLPTKIDSRTILDENGAEKLLGKGDMYIKSNNSDVLQRYHAPFVRIEDIKLILDQKEQVMEMMGVM